MTLHCTTLHYITLHYITLHYTTLHYITLHYTTLHHITLHYTTLRYITLHYTRLYYITLHYITFHYTTLHYITLRVHDITSTLHYEYITLRTYIHVCVCGWYQEWCHFTLPWGHGAHHPVVTTIWGASKCLHPSSHRHPRKTRCQSSDRSWPWMKVLFLGGCPLVNVYITMGNHHF